MRNAWTWKHTSLREVNRRKTENWVYKSPFKASNHAKHHPKPDTKHLRKLKDVCLDNPLVGQVLAFNGKCWENVSIGTGGPVSWIWLVDTFETDYIGKEGFLSVVNPTETGLILADPDSILTHAIDSPYHTDIDNTNKAVDTILVWNWTTHEYRDINDFINQQTGGTFIALSDTPSTYTPGHVPIVNTAGDALEWITPNDLICNCNLRELNDVDDTGIGTGYMLIWNGVEHEYVDPNTILSGVNTFINLSDTPSGYGGSNGYILQVSGSSVVFTDPTTLFTNNYLGLTDTPSNYTNTAGYFVSVNQGENGLIHTKPYLAKRWLNGDFLVDISTPDIDSNVYAIIPTDGFDGNDTGMDGWATYAIDIVEDGWYSVSCGGSVTFTNGVNGIRVVMAVSGSRNDLLLDMNTSDRGNIMVDSTDPYVFQYYQEDIVKLSAWDRLTTIIKASVPFATPTTQVTVRTGRALGGNSATWYDGAQNPETWHSYKTIRHSSLYIS